MNNITNSIISSDKLDLGKISIDNTEVEFWKKQFHKEAEEKREYQTALKVILKTLKENDK